MFKYVAIGLVAFVAGIAATFAAIGCADEHPDSFLAHFVNRVRASMVSETTGGCAETACMAPGDPSPCLETYDALPPLIKVEAPPMVASANRLPGAIVIN